VTRAGRLVALALVLLAPTAARAKRRAAPTVLVAERSAKSPDRPGAADRGTLERSAASDSGDAAPATTTTTTTATGGKLKTKTYTFGAMDVEGKLKTPQLLYFLNRVKLELDMSAPDKRSFMKELAKTADDKSL
jgi:hypothetical protein